jgi:long-subunit fatty acid transport protein
MKKLFIFWLIILSPQIYAQNVSLSLDNSSDSAFRIFVNGGIGFAKLDNQSEIDYNLDVDYFETIFNYKFSERFGLATGIGINELSGNAFNALGNFYQVREELRIPLLGTYDYEIAEKIKTIFFVGFYAKNIMNDEFSYIDQTQQNVFEGWGFGFQANVSFVYAFSDFMGFGLVLNSQSDFNNFETSSGSPFQDEQKIEDITSLGVSVIFNF